MLKQQRWRRVEKRAETLVLAALPKSVREECVAGRLTGILAIWCRVMVIYQPGSLLERATALKCLESPGEAVDAASAAKALRKWHRWLLRVRSVGGTPPDPTILIKALTSMCKKPLEVHTEAAFRIQLARSTLRVDINPSSTKVDELYGLLLAEMENLSHSSAAQRALRLPRWLRPTQMLLQLLRLPRRSQISNLRPRRRAQPRVATSSLMLDALEGLSVGLRMILRP